MNKYIALIIIEITLISCSSKKHVLTGKTSQNKRLVQLVTKLKVEDKINNKPMILDNNSALGVHQLTLVKPYQIQPLHTAGYGNLFWPNSTDSSKIEAFQK